MISLTVDIFYVFTELLNFLTERQRSPNVTCVQRNRAERVRSPNVTCVQPNRSRLVKRYVCAANSFEALRRMCPLAKRCLCAAKSFAARQTLHVCSQIVRGSICQPEPSR